MYNLTSDLKGIYDQLQAGRFDLEQQTLIVQTDMMAAVIDGTHRSTKALLSLFLSCPVSPIKDSLTMSLQQE